MKVSIGLLVMCVFLKNFVGGQFEDDSEVTEICCSHAEAAAVKAASAAGCARVAPPDYISEDEMSQCTAAMTSCCDKFFKSKDECSAGMKYAPARRCSVPRTELGKTCCEECSLGRWTGESQSEEACGGPPDEGVAPHTALRKNAYYQCCLEAASQPTTTEKKVETTTEKKIESTTMKKEKCETNSCEHICNDEDGKIRCQCNEGYRLQSDKKSCKDINECAEAVDDLCTAEDTVCHNTAGSFKCVPIKKRDVGHSCPPGFKKNVLSQVCDDINECQHPRPPCPKYLCENTIGGYKCAGKPGTPYVEETPGATVEVTEATVPQPRNDICPPGFRAGSDDECLDIDECEERLDDCQRLSQHCINTHGNFFCQDHVSKRCTPGFKVNPETGICEDINECEDVTQVCKRTEVCVNLPGAYNCKSKISTLPRLASKTCQEGTRIRPGGTICEDIDECREGTHLCDEFQNCINTYGGHECRCKNGFELDSSSGSCVDIDECALKLDNCGSGMHCLNRLGTFTCTRRAPSTTSRTTTNTPAPTVYDEDEYYDSEEDNSTTYGEDNNESPPVPITTSTTIRPSTRKPSTIHHYPPAPRPTSPITTPRPTVTTQRTTTSTTQRTTTFISAAPRTRPTYPNYPTRPSSTSTTPYRPDRPIYTRPTTPTTPRRPYRPEDRRRPENTPTRPEDIPREPSNTVDQPEEPHRTPENAPVDPYYSPRRPEDIPKPEDRPQPDDRLRPDNRPRRPEAPVRPVEPSRRPYDPRRPEERPSRPYNPPRPAERPREDDAPKEPELPSKPDDGQPDSDFDVNNVHCFDGYERDANGNCVDVNECESNRHICSNLEECVNREGGYTCECMKGFVRDSMGWCVTATTSSTTTSTTTTTPRTTTESTTITSTTVTTPRWRYPSRPRPTRPSTIVCDFGYTYDPGQGKCVDIDECARNQHSCAPREDCINVNGGYNCICGRRCRDESGRPPNVYYPVSPTRETPMPVDPAPVVPSEGSNIITVGAQYGQRGPRQMRPGYTRLNYGTMHPCPWGYKLTPDKRCLDIDECAKNVSQCGPMQRCENFYGGYSCQCPSGHKLYGQDGCEDIDECRYGNPCSYNGRCINTVGSFRCECGEGFRNAPSNDKVCMDIDECTENPSVCDHECTNTWGGYRCYCKRGYRLDRDNRTCVDVDECTEWSTSRVRGRLCNGECVNEPGSYRCSCPSGYTLSDDGKSCLDIDECSSGEATCAFSKIPGEVCQNTHGGYHCHRIDCPPGYQLESKHRCSRIQRTCPISDWSCLQQPSAYSYNFITFVANIYLPAGSVDLFTMHGPAWRDSVVTFELRMIDAKASRGVRPAELRCFDMRPSNNICVISLLCSLEGPQVVELELTMSLYQHDHFAGNAVARLIVIVSEYEF